MAKKRRLRMVIGGVQKPTEIQSLLKNSNRGEVSHPFTIRLVSGQKDKLEMLAQKGGIRGSELIRLLLEAALAVDLEDLIAFLKLGTKALEVAENGGDPRVNYKAARRADDRNDSARATCERDETRPPY